MADVTTSKFPAETYQSLFTDLLCDIIEDDSDNEEAIFTGLLMAIENELIYHVNVAKKLERVRQRVLKTQPLPEVREQ